MLVLGVIRIPGLLPDWRKISGKSADFTCSSSGEDIKKYLSQPGARTTILD
jgi:hypothetical protein